MKLLYQTHSPYARKVLVFAHEVGIADRIEVVHQESSPTLRNEQVFAENPLGKVPVLIRANLHLFRAKRMIRALLRERYDRGHVIRSAAHALIAVGHLL